MLRKRALWPIYGSLFDAFLMSPRFHQETCSIGLRGRLQAHGYECAKIIAGTPTRSGRWNRYIKFTSSLQLNSCFSICNSLLSSVIVDYLSLPLSHIAFTAFISLSQSPKPTQPLVALGG